MSRSKPLLARLQELTPGQFADFFALLIDRNRSATRDGKPFYNCRFRDARRSASCMVWGDSPWFEVCETEWREGQFYKIRGVYAEHDRYGPQVDIQNIRAVTDEDRADGFEPAEFVEHSRFDSQAMFEKLCALAREQIANPPLMRLVITILEKHAEALKHAPATLNKFFPFYGGLLEHILSVTQTCIELADRYGVYYAELRPPLNKDLVVCGAILHDLGRILEFDDNLAGPQPTVPGRFFGHLNLGRDLVRDTARELGDVDPDLLQMLEHIILTHLALPEWGSPRLPLIPECLIVHHADDLDAKLEMYVRCLSRDQSPGPFTDRDPVLSRHLYKGRGA